MRKSDVRVLRFQTRMICLPLVGEYVSSTYDSYDEHGEPGYIKAPKEIMVWLVRIGMTNKPLEVLDEDIVLAVGVKQNLCLRCGHKAPKPCPQPLPDIITIHRVDCRGGGHRGRHRPSGRVIDLELDPDPYKD